MDCGETDVVVLEFDHRETEKKRFNIGDAVKHGYSLKAVVEEMNKCDVRCANCHRRKTYGNTGYKYRSLVANCEVII